MLLLFLLLLGRVESQCSSLQFGVQSGELISAVIFGDVVLEGTCMGAMAVKGNAKLNKWNAGGSLTSTQMYCLLSFGELVIECGHFHGDILHDKSIHIGGRTEMEGYNQAQVDAKSMLDMDAAEAYYLELSHSITQMRGLSVGTQSRVVDNAGTLNFWGTLRDVDIFQVDSSVLCNARGIQFQNLLASSYTTVIINIRHDSGNPCYRLKLDKVNGFPFTHAPSHVLWNFYYDGDFELTGEFLGSLLAPRLNIRADNGNVQGQCISKSVTGSIFLSADWFTGCVPKNKCFILAQDCPQQAVPLDCIDPTWNENLDTCCPELVCAESCDDVICPLPVLCQGGYTSTKVADATEFNCCDQYACIEDSARTSVTMDPIVTHCPNHIKVELPNLATTFMHVTWTEPTFLFVDSITQTHSPGLRFSEGRTVVKYIGKGFKQDTRASCYFIVDVQPLQLDGACAVDGAIYENGEWIYDKCMRKCQCQDGTVGGCRRVRKELASMSKEERANYYRVWLKVYRAQDSGLVRLINNHLQFFSRGLHNNGGFLPWHRGFLLNAEDIFIAEDCTCTIPYFDWSVNSHVSASHIWGDDNDQMSGSGDRSRCVQTGQFGFQNGFTLTNGQCMQRRLSNGAGANNVYIQTSLFDAYPNPGDYDRFRNRIEHGPGCHDSIHCIVGGTMCSARSSNDPIFWSHHAHVDNIWEDWQQISDAHKFAYSGRTGLNSLLPTSPYTAAQMLDCTNLGHDGIHLVYFKEEEYLALTNAIGLMTGQQKQSIRHPLFSDPGQQLFSDMNMADADVARIRAINEIANLNAVQDTAVFIHRNIVERATGAIGLQDVIDVIAAGLAGKWLTNGNKKITADDLFSAVGKVIRDSDNVPSFMEISEFLLTDPSGAVVDVIEVQIPVSCQPDHKPVCADGRVFDNECSAQNEGYQVWNIGPCPQEPVLVQPGTELSPDVDGGATDSYGHAIQEKSECPDTLPGRFSECPLVGLVCYYGLYCCEEYETTATCSPQRRWDYGSRRWGSCLTASSCPRPNAQPIQNPQVATAVSTRNANTAAQSNSQATFTAAVDVVRTQIRTASRGIATNPLASATRTRVSVPRPAPSPPPRRQSSRPVPSVPRPAPSPPPQLPPAPQIPPSTCPRLDCPRGHVRPHCCPDGYEIYRRPAFGGCAPGCWTCRHPVTMATTDVPACCVREPICVLSQMVCSPPDVVVTIVPADKHNTCCPVEECRPRACELADCPAITHCNNDFEVAVEYRVNGVVQLDEFQCCPQYICQFNGCTADVRECSPGVFVSRQPTNIPPCNFDECPVVCDLPESVRQCRLSNNRWIPQVRNPPSRTDDDSCKWVDCPPYEPCDDPGMFLGGSICHHGSCVRGRTTVECQCEQNWDGVRCNVFVPPPRATLDPPIRSFLMPRSWGCDAIFCCNGFCFITRNLQSQLNGPSSVVSFDLVMGMKGVVGQGPDTEVYAIDANDFLAGLTPNGVLQTFNYEDDEQAHLVFASEGFTPSLTEFSDMKINSAEYPPSSEMQFVVNAREEWNAPSRNGVCLIKAYLNKERVMYFNDQRSVSHVTCATHQGEIDLTLEKMCDNPCIHNGVERPCSGNGFCIWSTGQCQCRFPWTGPDCESRIQDAMSPEQNLVPRAVVYKNRFNN